MIFFLFFRKKGVYESPYRSQKNGHDTYGCVRMTFGQGYSAPNPQSGIQSIAVRLYVIDRAAVVCNENGVFHVINLNEVVFAAPDSTVRKG